MSLDEYLLDEQPEDRGKLNIDHITIREWMATHLYMQHADTLEGNATCAVNRTDALLKALRESK